mmetsp:Transcript_109177/g.315443  ORF Transcript_109177/g.315443 Transcript_109177/m.315443 type:complete len:267 (-) Transcript_109177:474-1274(-)
MNPSKQSSRTRLIVLPPKPPPINREPKCPSMPSAQRCMMSSSREEFWKESRLEAWDSESRAPSATMSTALQAATPSTTRRFSWTMCIACRNCSAVKAPLCFSNASTETSRRCVAASSPMAFLSTSAAAKQFFLSSSYFPSTRACGALVLARTKCAPEKGTISCDTVRQSRQSNEFARPIPEQYWSRMPQPMPTKLFSAAFETLTRLRASNWPTDSGHKRASNLQVAISSAAELETPPPDGTSEATNVSKPHTLMSNFANSLTTPMR